MTDAPEVSVIIPSFKTTKYIGAAIESVLAQTFGSFEIIVVSDGCPDTSALEELMRSYSSRVRYIWQPNKGTAGARNTAIRAARGTWIVQLDADDMLDPTCLESQVRMMREHPEFDAVYCNSFNFADSPEAAAVWGEHSGRYYMEVSPSSGPVSFTSIVDARTSPRVLGSIIRRDTLLRIGLHDESKPMAEDLDLWLRMLKADPPGQIGYTSESLGRYRLRTDNATLNGEGEERLLSALEKAGRTLDLTAAERACLDRRLRENRFDAEVARGRKAVREGRWKDAVQNYKYCHEYSGSRKYSVVLMLLRTFPWGMPMGMWVWDRLRGRA
jgi:glycosyltransferase involved in cell wall biosynthesis